MTGMQGLKFVALCGYLEALLSAASSNLAFAQHSTACEIRRLRSRGQHQLCLTDMAKDGKLETVKRVPFFFRISTSQIHTEFHQPEVINEQQAARKCILMQKFRYDKRFPSD